MAQRMGEGPAAAAKTTTEVTPRLRPIAPKPPALAAATAPSSVVVSSRKRGRQLQDPVPSPATRRVWQQQAAAGTGGASSAAAMVPSGRQYYMPLLDLSSPSSAMAGRRVFPTERDLIFQLQQPAPPPRVIVPRPLRPLRTTICVDTTNVIVVSGAASGTKTAREVEAELELPGALPAVVSGRGNRVLLANDAYKAMVGQPVCPWLDSLPGAGASRRINGEVLLDVRTFSAAAATRLPSTGGAFPCTARISWDSHGAMASLTVPCAVERLAHNAGDYRFVWRFDSTRSSIIYCIA